MNHPARIVLLSGTPASGKDTITGLLAKFDPKYRHFKKHRSSDQPKADGTYIHVDDAEFSRLAAQGEFAQHHYRYGRGYGVARSQLEHHWTQGETPVIHVGKYQNIAPLLALGASVTSVLLLVSQDETLQRLQQRHPDDPAEVERRMEAYRQERAELAELIASGAPLAFDLMVDNSSNDPEGVSRAIAQFVESGRAT